MSLDGQRSDTSEGNSKLLKKLVGEYTEADTDTLNYDDALEKLGLDSIAAVQLAHELFSQLDLEVHPDELFGISFRGLARHMVERHGQCKGDTILTLDHDSTRSPSTGSTFTSDSSSGSKEEMHTLNTQSDSDVSQDYTESLECQESNEFLTASRKKPDAKEGLQSALPDPFSVLTESVSVFDDAARRSGFEGYWSTVAPLQNDILLAFINEAFIALGVELSEIPCGVEVPDVPHIPKYDRLMERLLEILEDRYIVVQRGGKVLRGSDSINVGASSDLCQDLRTEYPAFEHEAELLRLIGPRLADCLSGRVDPLSVLFGSTSSQKLMENIYRNTPMAVAHSEQLVYFFSRLLGSADGSRREGEPLRILEVGAGTGGTTCRLVDVIQNRLKTTTVEYSFTDIGASFVKRARSTWRDLPWMDFSVLDIEEDPPSALHAKYDIIVATNVVHATSDRTATCRRIRRCMRPGGILVLSELTRVIDWYDICFGLLDGWWLADGGKGYAIQPAEVWMDAFDRAGFDKTGHSSGSSEEANSQQLLVARSKSGSSTRR